MSTKKQKKKRSVKYITQKVIKKREIARDKKLKMSVIKMIKSDPKLYEKMEAQGSVSNAIDQLIPLGKELVQHPEIVEEMTTNKKMQDEFCNNPTVTTQLLQIPEVADNAAREPSLIVEILKDASKIKTLTKSLSLNKSLPKLPAKNIVTYENLIHMRDVIINATDAVGMHLTYSVLTYFMVTLIGESIVICRELRRYHNRNRYQQRMWTP
jgi:hypothetical protein